MGQKAMPGTSKSQRCHLTVRSDLIGILENYEPASAAFQVMNDRLKIHVVRAASAFGRDPGDDLVGVHDVAGLAVDAVGGVEHQLLALTVAAVHHLVDVGGAKGWQGLLNSSAQRV